MLNRKFKEPEIIKTANICTLTMIDEGSGWPEIAPIQNKYAEEIAKIVDDCWFKWYPRSFYCLHDNGGEFIGEGSDDMLQSYGVQSKPTIVLNF